MKINNSHVLPVEVAQKLQEINFYEHIKSCLIPLEQLTPYINVNDTEFFSHFEKIEKIPKERLYVGEISTLGHGEGGPNNFLQLLQDYFCESIFNIFGDQLFDTFGKLIRLSYYDLINLREELDVPKRDDSKDISSVELSVYEWNEKFLYNKPIFKLTYKPHQGGDPYHFIIDIDQLQEICNYIEVTVPIDLYVMLRLAEAMYSDIAYPDRSEKFDTSKAITNLIDQLPKTFPTWTPADIGK